jgi:hypothetical protein
MSCQRMIGVAIALFLLAVSARGSELLPPLTVSGAANHAQEASTVQEAGSGDQKKPASKDKASSANGAKKDKEQTGAVAAADTTTPESGLDLAASPQAPEMLGDLPPLPALVAVAPTFIEVPPHFVITKVIDGKTIFTLVPGGPVAVPGTGGTAVVPGGGGGGFKIADNSSPMFQDRVYFSANIFTDYLASTNNRLGTNIQHVDVYRESFGMEKTFLDRNASLGLLVPLNSLAIQSVLPALNGTHTALGDLSAYARYALFRDDLGNNWVSAGLAVTAPTGPSNFAGIDAVSPVVHTTYLQPFLGYLWNFGNWYVQGFSSVDTPANSHGGPTLFLNDLGVGYFVYRSSERGRFLRGIVPTLEVHVADPLTDRGGLTAANPVGAFDIVDLGIGLNVLLLGQSRLAVGVVTPVTGPRPFNTETIVQLRLRF